MRWRYSATPAAEVRLPRFARITAWIAAAGFLLFVVGFASMSSAFNEIALGHLESAKRVLALGSVAAGLGAVTVALAVRCWIKGFGSTSTRVVYSVVASACLIAIWHMAFWNLLGFQL